MGLMLPRCPDNASQAKSSLEGKLDCMSLNGYSYTARENVDLNRYYAASAVWVCWSRHCTACHQQLGFLEQKKFSHRLFIWVLLKLQWQAGRLVRL